MKTVARRLTVGGMTASEVRGLGQALDCCYAQLRERAQDEWQRRHPEPDPSDACIRVRIGRREHKTLTG
ncbi:hypothetical protein BH20VER3_BH20VER3_23850 [soil metagenome]